MKSLIIMSKDKALPKGLRNEEVERRKIKRPPVPYIPVTDPIRDAVKGFAGTKSFKVSLPDGTFVYHAVSDNGSNEAFDSCTGDYELLQTQGLL